MWRYAYTVTAYGPELLDHEVTLVTYVTFRDSVSLEVYNKILDAAKARATAACLILRNYAQYIVKKFDSVDYVLSTPAVVVFREGGKITVKMCSRQVLPEPLGDFVLAFELARKGSPEGLTYLVLELLDRRRIVEEAAKSNLEVAELWPDKPTACIVGSDIYFKLRVLERLEPHQRHKLLVEEVSEITQKLLERLASLGLSFDLVRLRRLEVDTVTSSIKLVAQRDDVEFEVEVSPDAELRDLALRYSFALSKLRKTLDQERELYREDARAVAEKVRDLVVALADEKIGIGHYFMKSIDYCELGEVL